MFNTYPGVSIGCIPRHLMSNIESALRLKKNAFVVTGFSGNRLRYYVGLNRDGRAIKTNSVNLTYQACKRPDFPAEINRRRRCGLLWYIWYKPPSDCNNVFNIDHDDANKWKHFPRYLPFVRGIHRSPWWIPLTRASDAELWCFLWYSPEEMLE